MVGAYNLVWAGGAAAGFFLGGTILGYFGPRAFFLLPACIILFELALSFWAEHRARLRSKASSNDPPFTPEAHPHPPALVNRFVRMSWIANPFAYIAINTLIAVTPGIVAKIGISTAVAGFVFSVWFFARFVAFWMLWHWAAWHYRFRWLLAAFAGMIFSFAIILIVPNLWVLLASQIVFGTCIGLVYYSSLFYSMDATEAKGAHGGIHEAAIGLGNFAGPAAGALSLHFFPGSPQSAALAVTLLLLGGLGGMLGVWRQGRAKAR